MTRSLARIIRCAAAGLFLCAAPSAAQTLDRAETADAAALLDAGLYEQGELAARERVDALTAQYGDQSQLVASASDVLMRALILNGRASDDRTIALAERTVRMKEQQLGPTHPDLIPSLLNLGEALISTARFGNAIAVAERALRLAEQPALGARGDLAAAFGQLGNALGAAGRYDDGLAALERSLALAEESHDGADVAVARTLEDLGYLLHRKGQYDRAGVLLRRAVDIQEASNIHHPVYVRTLNLLADQLWFEGQLLGSKQTSERAVITGEQTLRPDHPTLALALRSLAATLADLGDLGRSLELKKRALLIAERSFGPGHHITAQYLHSLGLAELDAGDYLAARLHFQQALTLYEAIYGATHELVATALSVLALADARLGDYARAGREQARAVAIHTKVGGPNHPFVAIALTELATVYLEQGQPTRSLPLLERALVIRERSLGPSHRDVARTLVDLASTLTQLGQQARAQRLARRAVEIWERLGVPDAPEHATVLSLYAELQRRRGNLLAAREYFERALAIRSKAFGPLNPISAETRSGLAFTLAALGERADALQMAGNAEATGRDHLRLILRSLPERRALSYAAARPRGLDLILSLSTAVPGGATTAADAVIRSRALVLDEIAARNSSHSTGDSDDARAQLVATQQRLANLIVRGPGQMPVAQFKALVDAARDEAETAEQILAATNTAFRAERSRAEAGLDDVVEGLPADGVLVSIVRYERAAIGSPNTPRPPGRSPPLPAPPVTSYVAFVVRPGQPPVAVSLGPASRIDALVAQWRSDIAAEALAPQASTEAGTGPGARASGATLRRAIWDPLTPLITNSRRVFVAPDGAFSMVPFAALPVGARAYLLETGPVIHYLSSERDLLGRADVTAERGLLALGGASFDSRGSPASPAVTQIRGARSGCANFRTMSFAPLVGTASEVRDVARVWNANIGADAGLARVLLGREAGETEFKRQASGYRVVHLATHGFFLDGSCVPAPSGSRGVGGLARATSRTAENPLLLSGLALAGANRRAQARADEDDGILTAEEVASLDLHGVEWAVLSACDTGIGEIKAGEGVFGLRRAFQVAGARTVVMSLWSVEDQATRVWMRALYEGRFQRKLSTADAVHQASLAVLRDRRAKGQSTHPFFWAAFVAAGDWR